MITLTLNGTAKAIMSEKTVGETPYYWDFKKQKGYKSTEALKKELILSSDVECLAIQATKSLKTSNKTTFSKNSRTLIGIAKLRDENRAFVYERVFIWSMALN